MQNIVEILEAKPYANETGVNGYLHANGFSIRIDLFGMHNKEYQADWLQTMGEFNFTESGYALSSGYVVRFAIPEDPKIPQSHWKALFEKNSFVEWAEMSCNRYTISDDSIESGDDDAPVNIDSKINIRMVERFEQSPRTFQLYCATEKAYPCGNFPIIAQVRQSANQIDIAFKGVPNNIGICLTSVEPATTTIDLGALNEGTYTLNLHNGGVTQTGTLVVEAGSYTAVFDESEAFAFADKQLNRIPEQTIWGLIGYAQAETAAQADAFLDALIGVGAEKRSYTPGDYREFWIDANGEITDYPGALWGYYFDRPFVFHYSDDLAEIDRLVRQYKDVMSIRVHTDKGERFLSWMYDR